MGIYEGLDLSSMRNQKHERTCFFLIVVLLFLVSATLHCVWCDSPLLSNCGPFQCVNQTL